MQKKSYRNIVMLQAWQDYCPNIARLNKEKIDKLNWLTGDSGAVAPELNAIKSKSLKDCVRFLIALNSINYQFWTMKENNFVRYEHNGKIGALAMYEAFESLYGHMHIHNFDTNILSERIIESYFGPIAERRERAEILKESFDNNKFETIYQLLFEHLKSDAINVQLAYDISKILPLSYSDPYLKKIQLCLYEISAVLNARGIKNRCNLTVAADYQVPKVLEALNILHYSESLREKINRFQLLAPNGQEERAIRAATIIACDFICKQYDISAVQLDRILWLARNDFPDKMFHLTRTSCY